jgi:hypothetical protein
MAKKALCLSGGATRGSFQVGALKCLYEQYGFRPDIITGTSVGAINGIKLACAPPPAVNDAGVILEAVASGTVDAQLAHLRELEQTWRAAHGRDYFFLVHQPFIGTPVDDALKENAPHDLPIGTQIDFLKAGLNIPFVRTIVGILAWIELDKIKTLLQNVLVHNAPATLLPVELQLRSPGYVNVRPGPGAPPPFANDLSSGTPLYMALVSLETGKLRYVTNTGAFYERDGASPVATAVTTTDIAAALDENLAPLATGRQNNITTAVTNYRAAVDQIAALHPELVDPNTRTSRQADLAAATERQRQRAIYWARAAAGQIRGVRISATVDPISAAIASSSLPVLLDPVSIGVEHYCDAGIREIVPIDIVLDKGVTQIVAILCSALDPPTATSMKDVGMVEVGMKAATEIAIAEVTVGDLAGAARTGIDTRIISPAIDVHSGLDVIPSLVEISMDYGWLRASDEMHGVATDRDEFRQTSELITRLRMRCYDLESGLATDPLPASVDAKWLYRELRVLRWAIMHLSDRRTALGLPQHPDQLQLGWATRWEKKFRGTGLLPAPTVWDDLQIRVSRGEIVSTVDLWPASNPRDFNADGGSIEDAGSDRIYWLVRGAVFEDLTRAPLANPAANVVVPNGLHQFLPRIPAGAHLMAEVQDPTTFFLVIGRKKYASPTPAWIAAAGLSGATIAIVPAGGLAQIPNGGVPSFLGSLTVVDEVHFQPLAQIWLERLQGSDTTADILIRNNSTSATAITVSGISLTGIGAAEGITVERVPTTIAANSIDFCTLRLKPTVADVFEGAIVIASDDTVVARVTVGLTVAVHPLGDMPQLQLAPAPLELSAEVNTTATTTVTITNSGTRAPERVTPFIDSPGAVGLFSVGGARIGLDRDLVRPGDLTPGGSIDIAALFSPVAAGNYTADLVVVASGTTSLNHPYSTTVRIPISGRAGAATIRLMTRTPHPRDFTDQGLDPADPDAPRTTARIDLGTVQPPVRNAATLFILNLGTFPLEIASVLGYYATPVITAPSTFVVAVGDWVEVDLDFGAYQAPTTGTFSETVRVLCNDPVTPEAQVVLTGAVAGARGAIRPEFLDFGTVAINATAQLECAFVNQGTIPLQIQNVGWRRRRGPFTLASSPLNVTVPAGGSAPLTVEFGPVPTQGIFGDYLMLETTEGVAATLAVQARTA